eukprot:1783613-Prorocentrum_lima.AAC.1
MPVAPAEGAAAAGQQARSHYAAGQNRRRRLGGLHCRGLRKEQLQEEPLVRPVQLVRVIGKWAGGGGPEDAEC